MAPKTKKMPPWMKQKQSVSNTDANAEKPTAQRPAKKKAPTAKKKGC